MGATDNPYALFSYRLINLGGKYGYIDENGEWQGAIRRVMDGVSNNEKQAVFKHLDLFRWHD